MIRIMQQDVAALVNWRRRQTIPLEPGSNVGMLCTVVDILLQNATHERSEVERRPTAVVRDKTDDWDARHNPTLPGDPRLGSPLPKLRMMLDAILQSATPVGHTEDVQYMMVEVRRLRQLREEMEKD